MRQRGRQHHCPRRQTFGLGLGEETMPRHPERLVAALVGWLVGHGWLVKVKVSGWLGWLVEVVRFKVYGWISTANHPRLGCFDCFQPAWISKRLEDCLYISGLEGDIERILRR